MQRITPQARRPRAGHRQAMAAPAISSSSVRAPLAFRLRSPPPIRAQQVALIASGAIGGTCVNIGCVPSKTLIRAAESLHNARVAARFSGITAKAKPRDWSSTVRQKDALVSELRQAKYVDLLPA